MKLRLLPLACLLFACTLVASAADWPQWRGPDRSGVSKETGLLKAWPKAGPKLLWTCRSAGIGFSGPAIVGVRLYTIGGREDMTYVMAIDVKDGKEIWKAKIGPIYTFKGNQWGDGPRSTPTVDGDHLYALDGSGVLVCLATADGKEVWRKDLIKDLGGKVMLDSGGMDWGYCESPLVDGDKLICTPGGSKGTLAALNKKTGDVLWRSKELTNKAPHSSAVVSNAAGVRHYVQESYIDENKGGVVSGFDPATGKVLWSESIFEGHSYSVAPTPIIKDNFVYVTSSGGSHLFELTAKGKNLSAKEMYPKKNFKKLKSNHGGAVLAGDHVYGHSAGVGWVCQDFKTGNAAWIDRAQLECKSGSIVAADGRLYLYSDSGTTVLLEANPKEWQESGRFDLPEKSKGNADRPTGGSAGIWTHPVVANGRLYLRDQELVFCYDVREKN